MAFRPGIPLQAEITRSSPEIQGDHRERLISRLARDVSTAWQADDELLILGCDEFSAAPEARGAYLGWSRLAVSAPSWALDQPRLASDPYLFKRRSLQDHPTWPTGAVFLPQLGFCQAFFPR